MFLQKIRLLTSLNLKMKVISYALFDQGGWEFPFYLRGIFFNIRMNRILYPDWHTMVYVSEEVLQKYFHMFNSVPFGSEKLSIYEDDSNPDRCRGMLWRMQPLFKPDVTHVLCRDADSVATFREVTCVKTWIESGFAYHAINDNQAHAGLMGGMIGFRTEDFKKDVGDFNEWVRLTKGLSLKEHGSDQNFLNRVIHPMIYKKLLLHNLSGAGCRAAKTLNEVGPEKNPLWVSNLISRYIGSAGVIDFELLRFFRSMDRANQPVWDEFESQFPLTFYWQH